MTGCQGLYVKATEEVVSAMGIQKKMTSFGPEKTRAGVGWVELP